MRKLLLVFLLSPAQFHAQADNEIQVYASPTIQKGWTIFEVHSNYTFRGAKNVAGSADWLNETLEITHGFGKNFEIGFYTFSTVTPAGKWVYQGNQIRPRITAPESWGGGKGFGYSLSLEFGFFRPDDNADFNWQGELRPIVDFTKGNWYWSFNPNLDFIVSGDDQGIGFSPQAKMVYTIREKTGIGFEAYSGIGSATQLLTGPALDLYLHPKWEIQAAFLFGLTDDSPQQVLKLLLGRRRGR